MPEFIHLHNHTHYSLLDAVPTVKELITAAKDDDQKAIALTDHGVMFGCYEFYLTAKKEGIKPIIGMEAYMANGSRFDKTAGKNRNDKSKPKKKNYFHLLLLAKNITGYKNLMKLTTLAHTEGFYYKPRIDKELLEKYSEGLVCSSACITGVLNAHIVRGDYDRAMEEAKYYKDLFGGDFYVEIQNHGLKEDEAILAQAPRIAKELDIKLVCTNDIHYIKQDHAVAHNVLLNIRDVTSATAGQIDVRDLRYRTPQMFYKSAQQMHDLFKDYPEAIESTLEIADKCNVEFSGEMHMPQFNIPKDSHSETLADYLRELTYKGLEEKFGEITDEYRQRADLELKIIEEMDFPGYFLIVWDFIRAAKELDVRVGPGRGSAAGSLVAYALEITNIDPLQYDLLFERFLNPARVNMPDIDIDFQDDKREKVINYVKDVYGEEAVAQIITFGTLSTRAALKDVGRVLGIDHNKINDINKNIPVVQGRVTPLKDAIELPELKWLKESSDTKEKDLIEFAKVLEGKIRNASTHAAGVVIAPGDLTDYVPLYKPSKSKDQSVKIATQYSMNELDKAGLLKMDFLGLRTLTIIDNALEMIKHNHDKDINIDEIEFNDRKTYDLLGAGNTLGVFQFESGGMQDYLCQLKPQNLEEIAAMNALYRPGPMENIPSYIKRKFGKEKIEYLHPIMKKSLEKTYGIIVYQEQVMQLVQDIAGFSLGEADKLRRAMGKKKLKLMAQQKPKFIAGAKEKGIDKKLAEEIFELINKFASYGFNKSHSVAYSYVAYQTAWLKANYPAEFFAANMTAELNSQEKIVALIDDAKRFGIEVLPPDVNKPLPDFRAEGYEIFFSMAAIKNFGVPACESIVKAREEKPFTSFFDFAARVDTRLINKQAFEALVCSGAFDSLHPNRAALWESIESALSYSHSINQNNAQEESLFGEKSDAATKEPEIPDVDEWAENDRLKWEKDVLNFYVSGHPLNEYRPFLNSLVTLNFGDKGSNMIGQEVRVAGIVNHVRKKLDKKNNTIAFVMLEDLKGKAECIFWSKTYAKFSNYLYDDAVIMCLGKSEMGNDMIKVVVDEVLSIEEAVKKYASGYKLWIDIDRHDAETINNIYNRFQNDKAPSTRILFNVYSKTNDYRKMYLADNVHIPLDKETATELINIFGQNSVGFLTGNKM